jgi:hypothetical protein
MCFVIILIIIGELAFVNSDFFHSRVSEKNEEEYVGRFKERDLK